MGPKRLDLESIRARVDAERARKGYTPAKLIGDLQPGAVFIVDDAVIEFPESRLPDGNRTMHDGRRVIVVQGAAICRTEFPKTLQVIPVTASMTGAVPSYCLELPDDEPGFDPGRKVALTHLVQPVLKSDLERFTGQLRSDTLLNVLRSLTMAFGLQQLSDVMVQGKVVTED